MLFVVAAHREDSVVLHEFQSPQHVGAFVDNVAGLIQRIFAAHKTECFYNALEFVGTTMHITDVESPARHVPLASVCSSHQR